MNENRYRTAFRVTLLILIAVVAGVGWLALRSPFSPFRRGAPQAAEASPTFESDQNTTPVDSGPPEAETPLAPIQLSAERMQSIGVKVGTVESKVLTDEIRSYGNVQADERLQVLVQTRFAGWIEQVYANATGDQITKGQPLFTIYSPDLLASEQEYLLAKKNAASLQGSSINSVADGAKSLAEAAKLRLRQLDIPETELSNLDEKGEASAEITFYSPASGYVAEKNVLPNMYVQPDTKLYTIANLLDVWVLAQVFQNDAGKIKPGDPAEITTDAYPGQVFRGKVDYLLPQLDEATRTLPVRLVFQNPEMKLRPGMYVNVSLKLPLGRTLVVPDTAIFHSGTKNLLFVYSGEGSIAPREVEIGPHVGDEFVVLEGAKSSERIVTSANFLIDSESQLQAAAGAFVPPPPGVGQAASVNGSPAQANVELTTIPSTPQKGNNTIRVKLTDQSGKPIDGAQVSVTFFMAAMPAMGMAAMKTEVQAAGKGGGLYEGSGVLGSGGTWQVTITAHQHGQTIASKQLSVMATGGM